MKINKIICGVVVALSSTFIISCGSGGSNTTPSNSILEVSLSGSYESMGYQYGIQQKSQLISYYQNTLTPIYSTMPNQQLVALVVATLKATLPPEFKDFYNGMSAATGLTLDEILKTAYFYDFDFTGCSAFASADPINPKNNYILHTYDGSQNFYKILKDKATILHLNPNNGDNKVTLVTFFGSLGTLMGINQNKLSIQLDNGLLSVPLPSDPATFAKYGMTKPQPTNLLPYVLLKESDYSSAKQYLLNNSVTVSAAASFVMADNQLNNDIYYLTPNATIMQDESGLIWPENKYLDFITNTFLNNPQSQPIESQQFIYSLNNDSPSLSFGRLQNIINFTSQYRGAPSYQEALNFINTPYNSGGITMVSSEGHPDATYFRVIYSYADNYFMINQTAENNWNTIYLNK